MNWIDLLKPVRLYGTTTSHREDIRSVFEMDFDRIIFSHPFRRLQDKTQVHPMPGDDFVHNRLTHSLEVSSVARSLGKQVGKEVISRLPELRQEGFSHHDIGAIVAAAALAHDVGNPPFGHSGESGISDFFKHTPLAMDFHRAMSDQQWADLTNFEGNAQGFRILTNPAYGLKLTLPVLAAFTKYPCASLLQARDKSRASQKKYGFFHHEQPLYHEVAKQLCIKPMAEASWHRHPLAFLVEAADDICYNIIDLEDGCGLGLVTYKQVEELMEAILGDRMKREKLEKMSGTTEKLSVLRAMAINALVEEASQVFLQHEQGILDGTFDQPLTDCIASSPVMKQIKSLSIEKIYQAHEVIEKEAAGFEVLDGLMNAFATAVYFSYFEKERATKRHKNALRLLPATSQLQLTTYDTLYEKLLVITDYVSGMTDSHALRLFQTLRGISIPGT